MSVLSRDLNEGSCSAHLDHSLGAVFLASIRRLSSSKRIKLDTREDPPTNLRPNGIVRGKWRALRVPDSSSNPAKVRIFLVSTLTRTGNLFLCIEVELQVLMARSAVDYLIAT